MCGPNLPRPSLGGALAVLNSPSGENRSPVPTLCGSLVFHSPRSGASSSIATHATFTPLLRSGSVHQDTSGDEEEVDMADYVVGIHASGDLLKPAFQSPILHHFGFREGVITANNRPTSRAETEILLTTPLEIGVGGDGIIGRRVTVWRRSGIADGEFPVAEGIVGYN
ncbi:hypothetical protein MGN70_002462 [Eutypa lata]|uniref:Uncharacterized protein n=1 Tax=Eutypa lata (strain UCR-EL1) TaxID=1287681 RepID=M7SP46_EUTLA|nr:hypothetical protein UCREL1_4812 [Eutypa lata UCREL1]KAI1255722.1 hypothetical protein MGN70_002462 [Eutypa lata]